MSPLVKIALLLFAFGFLVETTHAQNPQNTITFDNQSGEFAVVKLIGPTKVAVEVPNGQKRTVNVEGGEYYLLGRYGTQPKEYTYTKGDPFKVTESGRQYSVITITLHRVIHGNYQARPVSGEEFENAGLVKAGKHANTSPSEELSSQKNSKEENLEMFPVHDLKCNFEKFSITELVNDPGERIIIDGEIEGFSCAGKKIELVSNSLKGSIIHTKEYGKIVLKIKSSKDGKRGVTFWLPKAQNQRLINDLKN